MFHFFKSPAPLQIVATFLISFYQIDRFDIVILIGLLKVGIQFAINPPAPESCELNKITSRLATYTEEDILAVNEAAAGFTFPHNPSI